MCYRLSLVVYVKFKLKMYSIFYFSLVLFVVSSVENAPMKTEECKKYLMKYGYMSNVTSKAEDYRTALKDFQETFSLPITGKLDVKTSKQLQRPRCGKDDKLENMFTRNPWGKTKLTYKFRSFPRNGLQPSLAIKEISRAFDLWAKYIPVKFELRQEGYVDIDIHFMHPNKGDGVGNTLAYAYYPKVGDIYFDAEPWTAYSYSGTNLFNTAAHEIGHSLGLQHSRSQNALMNPYIFSYNPNLDLFYDDISRIQRLYGRKSPPRQVNICKFNKIDAAFYYPEEQSVFIIKDNYSWKVKDGKIQSDYPKEITQEWPGLPQSIDASYYYKNDFYFAKDTTIWKYDGKVNEYLTLVQRLNAAEVINENLYLFSGKEVWSFNMSTGGHIAEPGFPKAISTHWKGAPTSVDAAYLDQTNNLYFFKDSTVYKFNTNRELIQTTSLDQWLSC